MTTRIVIDRLDLTLHGIDAATAQAAAQLLGPALSRELQQRKLTARTADHLVAGRIQTPAAPQPATLAQRMARQIAQKTSAARKATP